MGYKEKYNKLVEAIKVLQETNPSDEGIQNWVHDNVPELAESEDEKIRKALKQGFFEYGNSFTKFGGIQVGKIIAWLEKQGEQKSNPVFDIEIPFGAKDSELQEASYYIPEGFHAEIDRNKVVIKRGEEPANKVEPKFKVDDWITNQEGKCYQIKSIYNVDGGYYIVTDKDGEYNRICFSIANEYFHLWTIQDAKDGDVLAEDSCIFIIQKLGDNSTAAKTYCALYNDGGFDDGSILYFNVDSTKPATKEQCDLLFRKMEEAGYEFDKIKNNGKK